MDLRKRITDMLSQLHRRGLRAGYRNEAAVLMPIFERAGEPHFLLTLRTSTVQTHKGQISFPGGMRHDGESLDTTALRETFEEVGIEPGQVEILGRFHDYLSITEHRVAAFAGFICESFTTTPQASEVAEVLSVPFNVFLDPSRARTERLTRRGRTMDVYFYKHGAHEIWGLTARIIRDFLEALQL